MADGRSKLAQDSSAQGRPTTFSRFTRRRLVAMIVILATTAVILTIWLRSAGNEPPANQPGAGQPPDGADTAPLLVRTRSEFGTGMEARISGKLRVNAAHCVVLQDEAGLQTSIAWPATYQARWSANGEAEVLDAGGQIVATTGQPITFSGGFLPKLPETAPDSPSVSDCSAQAGSLVILMGRISNNG